MPDFKALNQRLANVEKRIHKIEQLLNAPRKQDVESIADGAQPNQEQGEIGQNSPILFHGEPALKHAENSKYKWYSSRHWWRSKAFKWYKDRFEIVALIAGVGYAAVTYLQWRDLRHNFQVEQQALIQVKTALPASLTDSTRFDTVPIFIRNIGKSPALRTNMDAVITVVDSKKAPSFNFTSRHTKEEISLLFPSDDARFTANIYGSDEPRALYIGELEGLMSGTLYLVVFAQAVYQDQFGKHWARLCTWKTYSVMPQRFASGSCVAWNAIGDGNPPD